MINQRKAFCRKEFQIVAVRKKKQMIEALRTCESGGKKSYNLLE